MTVSSVFCNLFMILFYGMALGFYFFYWISAIVYEQLLKLWKTFSFCREYLLLLCLPKFLEVLRVVYFQRVCSPDV